MRSIGKPRGNALTRPITVFAGETNSLPQWGFGRAKDFFDVSAKLWESRRPGEKILEALRIYVAENSMRFRELCERVHLKHWLSRVLNAGHVSSLQGRHSLYQKLPDAVGGSKCHDKLLIVSQRLSQVINLEGILGDSLTRLHILRSRRPGIKCIESMHLPYSRTFVYRVNSWMKVWFSRVFTVQ
jgi:hypothetical protein